MDARLSLLAGSAAGAALALAALFWPTPGLPSGGPVAATINGHVIPVSDVELALEAMARDSRNPLPEDAPRHALARLIDEELLFQRGVELDLPRNASTVRRTIVLSMIDSITAQANLNPSDAELRQLFADNICLFRGEPLLRLEWATAPNPQADFTRPAGHPPDRLIRAGDLRRYLGESVTRTALTLETGVASAPFEVGNRWHRLQILERQDPPLPEFETHRDAVEALWRTRAEEDALETYLADLRRRADISTQPLADE